MSTFSSIDWINHSSYVFRHNDVALICDPWLDQPVFNNGWSLLSKAVFNYEYFKDITHIWCSHEHPDHFNVPTLTKIDPQHRSRIGFLYQSTADRLVCQFCRKLNFRDITELKNDEWCRLNGNVKLLCGAHGGEDSWLLIKTPDVSILNTNDCSIGNRRDAEIIRAKADPSTSFSRSFLMVTGKGTKMTRM
jgi:UDP-MurNAc hydroxylase